MSNYPNFKRFQQFIDKICPTCNCTFKVSKHLKEKYHKRNQLITETDWIAFPDVNIPNKQAWLDYRQALRDIPQNFTNPEDVIWPTKPE